MPTVDVFLVVPIADAVVALGFSGIDLTRPGSLALEVPEYRQYPSMVLAGR
jgi:hypothetical protein